MWSAWAGVCFTLLFMCRLVHSIMTTLIRLLEETVTYALTTEFYLPIAWSRSTWSWPVASNCSTCNCHYCSRQFKFWYIPPKLCHSLVPLDFLAICHKSSVILAALKFIPPGPQYCLPPQTNREMGPAEWDGQSCNQIRSGKYAAFICFVVQIAECKTLSCV